MLLHIYGRFIRQRERVYGIMHEVDTGKRRIKVLVADNTKEHTALIHEQLRANGFEVGSCQRSWEAIKTHINNFFPDVIYIDLRQDYWGLGSVYDLIREFKSRGAHGQAGGYMPLFVVQYGSSAVMSHQINRPEHTEEERLGYPDLALCNHTEPAYLLRQIKFLLGENGVEIRKMSLKELNLILDERITDIMRQIGFPAHIKGYKYVRYAVRLAVSDMAIMDSVTKELYPAVADLYDTTPSRVERAIRHAIENAWDRGDPEVISNYFGYSVHMRKGKPTNSEFISLIADKIQLTESELVENIRDAIAEASEDGADVSGEVREMQSERV